MKLVKSLLITSCALPAVVVPMTTMTSCSQSWGSARPLSIGSTLASDGPYRYFTTPIYDVDGKNMLSYLQSNYSVQPNGYNLAYTLPMKFVDSEEETQRGTWEFGSSGWYKSGDSALISYATDKWKEGEEEKRETVTNARNAALSSNIDFISSIGSGIKNFIELALQYTTTQLNKDNLEQTKLDLTAAWGGDKFSINYGSKPSDQNRQFFEFIFALSNLVGADVAKALMKSSSINFSFYPPGASGSNKNMPLPSYKLDNNGNVTDFSDDFKMLLENNAENTFDPAVADYYTSKSAVEPEENPDDKDNPFHYIVYTYDYVPVHVALDDLTSTYINPTNTDENGKSIDSFLVSDYYSSKNQITSTIGNSWKNSLPSFTDCAVDEAIPTKQSFTLKGQSHPATLPGTHDSRLSWLFKNGFIILLSYGVKVYVKETSKGSGEWVLDPDNQKKNRASMNKIQNLFPSFFADDGMYGDSLYKTYKASEESDQVYVFDNEKINEKVQALINLLNRTSADGRKIHASEVSPEGKKLLRFLGYLFSGDEKSTIDTNVFLSCKDLPQD